MDAGQNGYYLALRRTQGTIRSDTPDWNPWLEFFLRASQSQKQRLEKNIEREHVMLAALPELSVLILELAREHGRVTVAEAGRVSGASRDTIKEHLKSAGRAWPSNLARRRPGFLHPAQPHPSGGVSPQSVPSHLP